MPKLNTLIKCSTFLVFIIATHILKAQSLSKAIFDTWVASKVTFRDGEQLADAHPLKNVYIKYRFSRPDKVNITTVYTDNGSPKIFQTENNTLIIKATEGWIINTYQIDAVKDTLVLLQAGAAGFNDPDALKFYFVTERNYQNNLALQPSDILKVRGGDTIYKQTPKIYASYKGDSFREDMYNGIRSSISMDNRAGNLLATFVVSKTGTVDSLKILEGIDANYNEKFVKVFNQNRKKWQSAMFDGRAVAVQMSILLRYYTSATAIPAALAAQKANAAFNSGNYELALYYFDEALVNQENDQDNLHKRGLCKLMLGNKAAACEDWSKAKALGGNAAIEELLKKYCF